MLLRITITLVVIHHHLHLSGGALLGFQDTSLLVEQLIKEDDSSSDGSISQIMSTGGDEGSKEMQQACMRMDHCIHGHHKQVFYSIFE
jgi:hypothetical protein